MASSTFPLIPFSQHSWGIRLFIQIIFFRDFLTLFQNRLHLVILLQYILLLPYRT